MKPDKILKISLSMVKANKLRSWLTIIGVIIGIASVMVIVTTGEYFQNQVTETLEGFGSDTITVTATYPPFNQVEEDVAETGGTGDEFGSSEDEENSSGDGNSSSGAEIQEEVKTPELTKMDVFALRNIPTIKYINVNVENSTEMKFGGEKTSVWTKGVDSRVWPEITKKKIIKGRMLKPGDRNVVVIPAELASETFKHKILLNQMVLLNGKSCRVIGILEKDDSILGSLSGNYIYMPYEDVYSLAQNGEDMPEQQMEVYDSIEIQLYNNADLDPTVKEIERKLRLSRRVNEKNQDFDVSSPKALIEGTRKLIGGLTAFLTLIAGISLLVGSTGIANTMFTSVLEKTKEIGIMKAIGTKNEDILLIFLCNAAMIGLVGGIIGIVIGTLAVQLILFLASLSMGTPFKFTLSITGTIVATIFSIAVGLIAGLVPAKNAAELKPVDALRYE